MNFWYFFTSLGIELLNENGTLSYIAPGSWLTTDGGEKMRNHIMKKTIIKEFIDFGNYMIFENVLPKTMIFLLEKNINNIKTYVKYSKILNKSFLNLEEFLNKVEKKEYVYYNSILDRKNYKEGSIITFLNNINENIMNKMKTNKNIIYLGENEITQGIIPNPDIIGKRNITKISEKSIEEYGIKIGDPVFVVPKNYFNILTLEEKEVLKPLYETENVDRYYFNSKNNKELIYLTQEIKETSYPNIIKHLLKFKEIMEERRENIKGNRKFYNLHWPREEKNFKKGEKILSIRMCPEYPIFSLTEEEAYVMLTFNIIKTGRTNMKYLTGLLNSKLVAFWLKYMGKMKGDDYQIDKKPLMNIPIKIADEDLENKIIKLVEEIIELKKLNKDTQDLENQIDEMFYDLYELTEEEKGLVRNFNSK